MGCMKIEVGDGATCKENGIDASYFDGGYSYRMATRNIFECGTRAKDSKW